MSDKDSVLYDVSIVVPCYQEEKHLRESVGAIYTLLNTSKYKFEVIFVDDCSTDKTRDVILSIVKDFPNTKYLFHKTNTGRGGAFIDGVKLAEGRYIGFLDIDLEVSHVYLINIILELENGYDLATVCRHYALTPSPVFILRHILSAGYKKLIHTYLGVPSMDTETGFKFFRRECIQHLSGVVQNKKWFFDTEVMVYAHFHKYKIKEVNGLFIRRKDKTSTVKIIKDTIDYFVELARFKRRLKAGL